jgi:phosphate transport system ATP-binding protein
MTNLDASERVMDDDPPAVVKPAAKAPRAPATEDRARAGTTATAPGRSMTLTGLHAYYGATHAIKDVSLHYAANEVTAMIGPSGCGKSTVLRCLNRMHEEIPGARTEGRVTLDDIEIYGDGVDVTSVRRAIGMVFQKPNPFPTMSIYDNVAAGL